MSEWWTYRLTSFLLFSPRTYYRLIELYNLAIWPAQIAGVAIGLAIVALLIGEARPPRSHHRRPARRLLAVGRMGVSLPALRADQLGGDVVRGGVRAARRCSSSLSAFSPAARLRNPHAMAALWIAVAIVAISVLGYPLLAPLAGRPWTTAEIFGVAADPTAIATVAVLALVRGRIRWLLLVVPLLWCAIAAATLWAMNAPEACVVLATGLLALWPAVAGTRRDATDAIR